MTDDLIRRLLAVDTASADGASLACNWYRNPDGREAAAEIARLQDEVARLRSYMTEIAKGEGPFSRDQLTHAYNTINAVKQLATDALAGKPLEDAQ